MDRLQHLEKGAILISRWRSRLAGGEVSLSVMTSQDTRLTFKRHRTNLLLFFSFLLLLISIIVPAKSPREVGSGHLVFRLRQCFLQTQQRLLLRNIRNQSGQSGGKMRRLQVTCGDCCGEVHVRGSSSCLRKKICKK